MLSLRVHLAITAGLLGTILGLAAIGNALRRSGAISDSPPLDLAAKIVFSGLALAFCMSAVPLIAKIVLEALVRLGDGDRPVVSSFLVHERLIVAVYWLATTLSIAIALSAAVLAGTFTSG